MTKNTSRTISLLAVEQTVDRDNKKTISGEQMAAYRQEGQQAEPDFALMGDERIPMGIQKKKTKNLDKKDRGHDGVKNIAQKKRRNTKKAGNRSQVQTGRGEQ